MNNITTIYNLCFVYLLMFNQYSQHLFFWNCLAYSHDKHMLTLYKYIFLFHLTYVFINIKYYYFNVLCAPSTFVYKNYFANKEKRNVDLLEVLYYVCGYCKLYFFLVHYSVMTCGKFSNTATKKKKKIWRINFAQTNRNSVF